MKRIFLISLFFILLFSIVEASTKERYPEAKPVTLVVGFTYDCDYICPTSGDCSTILQNAFDAVTSSGGKVSVREGIYKIENDLTISKASTTVEGQGAGTIFVIGNFSGPTVDFVLADAGCVLKDMTIQGQIGDEALLHVDNLIAVTATDCQIINCDIDFTVGVEGRPAIRSTQARTRIIRNRIESAAAGIVFAGGCSDSEAIENTINSAAIGISVASADVMVQGNRINDSYAGLSLAGANRCQVQGNNFYGSTVEVEVGQFGTGTQFRSNIDKNGIWMAEYTARNMGGQNLENADKGSFTTVISTGDITSGTTVYAEVGNFSQLVGHSPIEVKSVMIFQSSVSGAGYDAEFANVNAVHLGDGSGLTGVGLSTSSAVTTDGRAGENLTKAEVVYISGATGNKAQFKKADFDSSVSEVPEAVGIAAETKNNGQPILIRNLGVLTGIDMSDFSAGDEIWLWEDGQMTNVQPSSGVVVHVGHALNNLGSPNGALLVHHETPVTGVYGQVGHPAIIRMGDGDVISFRDGQNNEIATMNISSMTFNLGYVVSLSTLTSPGSKIDIMKPTTYYGSQWGGGHDSKGWDNSSANSFTVYDEYTFPIADGNNGDVPSTNGAGVVTWDVPVVAQPTNEIITFYIPGDTYVTTGIAYYGPLGYDLTIASAMATVTADGTYPNGTGALNIDINISSGIAQSPFETILGSTYAFQMSSGTCWAETTDFVTTKLKMGFVLRLDIDQVCGTYPGGDPFLVSLYCTQE